MFDSNRETFGIGVDVENVSRFAKSDIVKNVSFLHRVFTEEELACCVNRKLQAQQLATRFAGKEAIFKALSSICLTKLGYHDIQIISNERSVPSITIQKDGFAGIYIYLSFSHTHDLAIAFAIARRLLGTK